MTPRRSNFFTAMPTTTRPFWKRCWSTIPHAFTDSTDANVGSNHMRSLLARRRTMWVLAVCTAAGVLDSSQGQAEDFFKGKTIKLYIGSGPGGGYDLFGRLVARHIGRHLLGNPTVTPQNMPGAGSILATNYIYNVAPKDGLSLAIGSPSLI